MEKLVRKAVRCYLIKNNKVVAIKYKKGYAKEGYYDIPGGKIEEGETPEQTAIREMKEETGICIDKLEYKGIMTVEYPDRKYVFDIFTCYTFEGTPEEFEENTSEWIEIDELLQKEKILSSVRILDNHYKKVLLEDSDPFRLDIVVDEQENIVKMDDSLETR